MTKRNKILYWIFTGWLALGMTSTGIVQILQLPEEGDLFTRIGFPHYLMPFLGVSKLLGVIAILVPRFPLLKEWAYAGFAFSMIGALYAHIVVGSGFVDHFGPSLLLVLTGLSWYLRPASRKVAAAQVSQTLVAA